jgi:hypothetical protein
LPDAALAYALAGLPVLPLAGKVPRIVNGLNGASTDLAVVAEWWARWPEANIGIRTGTDSGLVVLDVDPCSNGRATLEALRREYGPLPRTPTVLTGSGGEHMYFRYPATTEVRNSAGKLGAGLDVRGEGGYVVAPPSVHASGNRYTWVRSLDEPLADCPPWLLASLPQGPRLAPPEGVTYLIPMGQRNAELASIAGTLRRRGLGESEILAALRAVNQERCRPALDAGEVERIAGSISRYPPSLPPRVAPYDGPTRTLTEVVDSFRSWLHLPDPGALYVMLAAVVANRRSGDPCWLLLVAASGAGKTELLSALGRLDEIVPAGVLTEASLLSGTSRKETAPDARGGLLRMVGDYGILTMKDFGSVLSMNRDARAAVLAALREIYDGSWTRHVGTDGGKTLHWEGKLGLIAGCTPAIDRHHAAVAALGERFAFYRLEVNDPKAQGRAALSHLRRERGMRAELRDVVAAFFMGLDAVDQPTPLADSDVERLVALAHLVTRARSPVERESYSSREIELVPDPEVPGRLVGVLASILESLRLIGLDDRVSWPLVIKVAFDSMPAQRRKLLEHLIGSPEPLTTTAAATNIGLPTTTVRRTLEDLAAHHLLARGSGGEGRPDRWAVSDWVRRDYAAATLPESSAVQFPFSPTHEYDDISGTVTTGAPNLLVATASGSDGGGGGGNGVDVPDVTPAPLPRLSFGVPAPTPPAFGREPSASGTEPTWPA